VGIPAIGSLLWTAQTLLQIQSIAWKTGHSRWWAVVRMMQPQMANVPFFVAGVLLLRGSADGLYWLAGVGSVDVRCWWRF
jgi:hypothetical protein